MVVLYGVINTCQKICDHNYSPDRYSFWNTSQNVFGSWLHAKSKINANKFGNFSCPSVTVVMRQDMLTMSVRTSWLVRSWSMQPAVLSGPTTLHGKTLRRHNISPVYRSLEGIEVFSHRLFVLGIKLCEEVILFVWEGGFSVTAGGVGLLVCDHPGIYDVCFWCS